MIIRKSFSKGVTKRAFLLGIASLVLIGSGALATQASFNDSGNSSITGSAGRLYPGAHVLDHHSAGAL